MILCSNVFKAVHSVNFWIFFYTNRYDPTFKTEMKLPLFCLSSDHLFTRPISRLTSYFSIYTLYPQSNHILVSKSNLIHDINPSLS